MNPIEFKECNTAFAKDQSEYIPFPAFNTNTPEGEIIGCWSLSVIERLRVLITGRIWHSMWTFNQPLQPQRLTTKKTDLIQEDK